MCNLHKLRGEFMDQFFASTKEKTEEYLGVEKAVDEGTFDVVFKKAGSTERYENPLFSGITLHQNNH